MTVGILALTHIILANLAFTDYPGFCEEIFPCPINKIYSQTFASLPYFGHLIALYPAANIAPISMQAMSLNANLHANLGGKWKKNQISVMFCIAAFFIVITVRDISILQTYAGGICGIGMSLGLPGMAAYYKFKQKRYLFYVVFAAIIASSNLISNLFFYKALS